MKIAVCLSGHYRTFDQTYDSWEKKVFSKYDCDVFLHTWNVSGNRKDGDDIHVNENMQELAVSSDELKKKYGLLEAVVQNYDEPLAEFIEKSKRVRHLRDVSWDADGKTWRNKRVTHLYSMWYKAYKCFQLAEQQNKQYDWVIKSRPDIRLTNGFIFTMDEIHKEAINWPWYNSRDKHYSEPHDYFAIGNFQNMKIYNDLYNHMEEMESVLDIENKTEAAGTRVAIPGIDRFLNPHTLLFFYIQHMGLLTNVITNTFELVRG